MQRGVGGGGGGGLCNKWTIPQARELLAFEGESGHAAGWTRAHGRSTARHAHTGSQGGPHRLHATDESMTQVPRMRTPGSGA